VTVTGRSQWQSLDLGGSCDCPFVKIHWTALWMMLCKLYYNKSLLNNNAPYLPFSAFKISCKTKIPEWKIHYHTHLCYGT
jgi:hypothetical protein